MDESANGKQDFQEMSEVLPEVIGPASSVEIISWMM
jgi:hypothetical protein